MKNKRYLKKVFLWCGVLGMILIFFAGSVLFLYAQKQIVGENPIKGMNENFSHMPVTGKNYTLNYQQEQEYIKEEEQRESFIEQEAELPLESVDLKETDKNQNIIVSNPGVGSGNNENGNSENGNSENGNGQSSGGGEGNGDLDNGSGEGEQGENTGGDDEYSKLPTIICSLTDGQEISGAFLSFTVEAISYKQVQLNSFCLNVTVNGNQLYSSGEQNGVISYRTSEELQEGSNEVIITAVDKEGYTSTKNYYVNVNSGGERPEGGTMRVSLRADVLGLGTIMDETVTFYEGENLPYVVDRAFQQSGISYSHSGTFDYGFYLQRIYLAGITNGYQIPQPIQQKLEEENCSFMGYESDSPGERDFYAWAGWVYRLDGYFPDGFSTLPAGDGSEIEILFTLNNGAEYNGTWFTGNW